MAIKHQFLALVVLLSCYLSMFIEARAFTKGLCPSAIFGFGDSLLDTGNRAIVQPQTPALHAPYDGTGRYSDGMLVIDYLVKNLHLGKESLPSLTYNGTKFMGLNFAYSGATVYEVQNPFASPQVLDKQIEDFHNHQRIVIENDPTTMSLYNKALFYIEIGGDDINFAMPTTPYDLLVNTTIPSVIKGIQNGIERLYGYGARNFLVFNMPAPGCAPSNLQANMESSIGELPLDEYGCVDYIQQVGGAFNDALHNMVMEMRLKYAEGQFLYYNWHANALDFIKHSHRYGFTNLFTACCGTGGGNYNCASNALCGCNANATVCQHPSKYLSWDGIHQTHEFYHQSARAIIRGDFVDPNIKLKGGCGVSDN